MSSDEKKLKQKLVELIREGVSRDNALRDKFQIGEKFRFVRDRLQSLLDQLEQHLETIETAEKKAEVIQADDEMQAYVYLYNSQGVVLQTWINMLTPKLFYEYSVNRPIYLDKNNIESLIRSKANRVQHAYLTVTIKHNEVINNENAPKDVMGNTVTKVREGALRFDKLVALNHNDHEYVLTEQGTLVKKPAS